MKARERLSLKEKEKEKAREKEKAEEKEKGKAKEKKKEKGEERKKEKEGSGPKHSGSQLKTGHMGFHEFMSPVGMKSSQKRPSGGFHRKNPPLPRLPRTPKTGESQAVKNIALADFQRHAGLPVTGTKRSVMRKIREEDVANKEAVDQSRAASRGWYWLDQSNPYAHSEFSMKRGKKWPDYGEVGHPSDAGSLGFHEFALHRKARERNWQNHIEWVMKNKPPSLSRGARPGGLKA